MSSSLTKCGPFVGYRDVPEGQVCFEIQLVREGPRLVSMIDDNDTCASFSSVEQADLEHDNPALQDYEVWVLGYEVAHSADQARAMALARIGARSEGHLLACLQRTPDDCCFLVVEGDEAKFERWHYETGEDKWPKGLNEPFGHLGAQK